MKRILIQLDTDSRPSVFDRIVALDAGADEVVGCGAVRREEVESLIFGGMFTRGPKDLHNTAVFIGGGDVDLGDDILEAVSRTFFGPLRMSVMVDCNGSNTTAAAAVLSAGRHINWTESTTLVLGGTGPVGRRVAELVGWLGGRVRIASRDARRAETAAETISDRLERGLVTGCEIGTSEGRAEALAGAEVIVAAGASGVQFLEQRQWQERDGLRVAIDLNAVPPVGLEGIDPAEAAQDHAGVVCYGALAVGGLKMRIHKAAIERLFSRNDLVFDARAIYGAGEEIASK